MAVPPNTSAANATPLTMNTFVTLDVSEAAAPLHEVWYTYTGTAADILVGYYAAAIAGTYVPVTAFFEGTPDALTPSFGFSSLVTLPMQMQLVEGTTYYFRIRHNGPDVTLTHPLQLSFSRAPNLATPVGALAINDDSPTFPLVLLSPTTGAVLQARDFPAGETGTVLPNGITVWHDVEVDPQVIRLYDATLTLLTTAVWAFDGSSPPTTNNRSDTFYLGDPGGTFPAPTRLARVTSMSQAGVMGPTVWTLPEVGLRAIGVSRDDTVLYHHGQATGGSSIQRWNLSTNTAMSALAATVSGYTPMKDLLVLLDDSIVSGYVKASAPYDSFLRQYSTTGTVLHEHTLGSVQLNRITFALDDPASVWVWSFLTGGSSGNSRFQNIRLSDGAVLTTFDSPRYEGGAYRPVAPAPPPPAPTFGHSPSCPFVILPPALTPPVPTEPPPVEPPPGGGGGEGEAPFFAPSYHLDARYIRRLRRAPHVNNEHLRVFYRRFELDLERGQALASGQGSEPVVLLRLSRDGGQTWGEESRMAAGHLGEYQARVLARRLGHARDTVFEVVVSDPVAWSLVGAWLDLEPGTS